MKGDSAKVLLKRIQMFDLNVIIIRSTKCNYLDRPT